MNKTVKIASFVAFTAIFSVFTGCPSNLKQATAMDLSNAAGKAASGVIKAANKAMEPKGPIKVINITGVPSEYEGYFAQIIAAIPEDPYNSCMPPYLTLGYEGTPVDTVSAGEVKVHIPCDSKERLITLTITKDGSSADAGFIYAKDADRDVCKSKETMPVYSLSDAQIFSFSDFMPNETCKGIADAANKK
jgi:hypothetical protein